MLQIVLTEVSQASQQAPASTQGKAPSSVAPKPKAPRQEQEAKPSKSIKAMTVEPDEEEVVRKQPSECAQGYLVCIQTRVGMKQPSECAQGHLVCIQARVGIKQPSGPMQEKSVFVRMSIQKVWLKFCKQGCGAV